ncbi:MAG: hypothetical protein KHZ58_05065 [Hungatella hathewayi]|nr:hypothetical protein [Hungatella hathewayi]
MRNTGREDDAGPEAVERRNWAGTGGKMMPGRRQQEDETGLEEAGRWRLRPREQKKMDGDREWIIRLNQVS